MKMLIEVSEHVIYKGVIELEVEEMSQIVATGLTPAQWVKQNLDPDDERVVDMIDSGHLSLDVVEREVCEAWPRVQVRSVEEVPGP